MRYLTLAEALTITEAAAGDAATRDKIEALRDRLHASMT